MDNKQVTVISADVVQFRARDFHGAAIIDQHGQEIPITEKMIGDAIETLVDYLPNWQPPLPGNKQ